MNFNEKNLKTALSRMMIGKTLYFFPETGSTNTLAFRLAEEGASEGTVVIADCQTEGRGRMRRKWLSPPGSNLYTSIILRPEMGPALASLITITAGVAVAELLSSYCPGVVHLKWPNDVLINGRKVCGILASAMTNGKRTKFVVLGIGLNINMKKEDMPPDLRDFVTSLREETGGDLSRLFVAVKLFEQMGKFYHIFLNEGFAPIRDLWHDYSGVMNKYVEVACGEEVIGGRAAGVDETGALILIDGDGKKRRVIAGDALLL